MSRKHFLIAALSLAIIISVSGCAGNYSKDALPTDKYVALEENFLTRCTIINGSYDLPPHIAPHVGAFDYDGSDNNSDPTYGGWANYRGFISNNFYPAINDSFKVLWGTLYYRDLAPSDTDTGMRIRGIYGYPCVFESGFVLQNIDANGTVYGSYDNASIVLRYRDTWTSPVSTEIESGGGMSLYQKPFSYTASFNTTWTIANLGVFDKSNLARYNNSPTGIGYSNSVTGADPREK